MADVGDAFHQVCLGYVRQLHAADLDGAAIAPVPALEQSGDGALATAGFTNDSGEAAFRHD